MIDHDRIPLARIAIIRCELALNTTGCWGTRQLLQHLQDIIRGYPMKFAGCAVQLKFKNCNTQLFLSVWILKSIPPLS